MGAPLTEAAIQQVRDLIATGQLTPGSRLPPEAELADVLGTSRSTVREAVRALVTARVLDVRRGDGTYVTSLRPELLLEGIGAAADLMHDDFTLELVQVRRILEPAATAMAATRINDAVLDELEACLHRMSDSSFPGRAGAVRRGVPRARGEGRGQRDLGVDAQRGVEPHEPGTSVARGRRGRCQGTHHLGARRDPRRAAGSRPAACRGCCTDPRLDDRGVDPSDGLVARSPLPGCRRRGRTRTDRVARPTSRSRRGRPRPGRRRCTS